jgi:hypothetical protein
MSLRDRLREAGLLDESGDGDGFRVVSATCPRCEQRQHLLVLVGQIARCVMCGDPLPNAPGIA